MSVFEFSACCPTCGGTLTPGVSSGPDRRLGPSIAVSCGSCDTAWLLRATVQPAHLCPVCGRAYDSAQGLSVHVGRNHPDRYGVSVEASERPRPLVDWLSEAACAGMDPNLFIPPQHDAGRPLGPKALARVEQIKEVCAGCPVSVACLEDADADTGWVDHSIRGGLTPKERHDAKRRNRRAS